jgi:hypothetical protein
MYTIYTLHLTIGYHLIISDSVMRKRLQNVYSLIKQRRLKSHWVSPYDNHLPCTLSPTNLLPTVDYFCFLYVSSSSVKTPLSWQVRNLVFIPPFNVISSVLSMVLFLLEIIMLFSKCGKDSLYPVCRSVWSGEAWSQSERLREKWWKNLICILVYKKVLFTC